MVTTKCIDCGDIIRADIPYVDANGEHGYESGPCECGSKRSGCRTRKLTGRSLKQMNDVLGVEP